VPSGRSSQRSASALRNSCGAHAITSNSHPRSAARRTSFCHLRAPTADDGVKWYEISNNRLAPDGAPALNTGSVDSARRHGTRSSTMAASGLRRVRNSRNSSAQYAMAPAAICNASANRGWIESGVAERTATTTSAMAAVARVAGHMASQYSRHDIPAAFSEARTNVSSASAGYTTTHAVATPAAPQ
jgi:hypothetical protein